MYYTYGVLPLRGAERIQVQIEDMSIPISVKELDAWVEGMSIPTSIKDLSNWARNESASRSELSSWLNLLDLESRAGLIKILKAPLIKDRSMAREMLRSWVGRELLDQVSDLIRLDEDRTGDKVFNTLELLLERQPEVSTLGLLKALPAENIYLDLDALLGLANRWRAELEKQQRLVLDLGKLAIQSNSDIDPEMVKEESLAPSSKLQKLVASHRGEALRVEVWTPSRSSFARSSWVVFMPGLGGTQDHFRWLARLISYQGWPVVVLEHPGSDAKAVKALLEGNLPAPGVEVVPDRLKDLYAVLEAREQGVLDIQGGQLVLMGHSLGALTAFLASGAVPEDQLETRCQEALSSLSLTNLSQLLQCQMIDVALPPRPRKIQPNAVIALNSFGSLLWPNPGGAKIEAPTFLAGGTYDLITPAVSEQLRLLLSTTPNPLSRTLLIKGASHFSPIRVEGQVNQRKGKDLFQLGEALVGFQPLEVQRLLGKEIIRFLENFEAGKALEVSANKTKGDLEFYILDRTTIDKLVAP